MKPINPNMGPLTEETDFLDPMALLQSTGRPLLGDAPELPITKNAHKGLSGNGEAHSTIEVYDNGFFLLKTTVDANGRWSFTPGNALADGEHSYQIRAIDRAGNVGQFSAPYQFIVDTQAPVRPLITQLSDGDSALANGSATNNLRPTLSGDAEANSTVSVYGNGVLLGTTTADASGHWVFSPATSLAEQAYNFTVTATDRAGWVSPESSPVNVLLDATAPGKPAITQVMADEGQSGEISAGGVSHDTTPLFSGTAEARAIIKVYDGATLLGETDADSRGRWSFDVEVALATGSHSITVTATDAAGNTSVMSDAFTFSVELYMPPSAPSITSVDDDSSGTEVLIPNGGITKDGTPVLHGTAPAGVTAVKVYDGGTLLGQTSVDAQGNWVFTVPMPLPEGTHTLTATSVDARGTASEPSNSYQLTTDYTAPDKPLITQVSSDEGEIGPITPGGVTQDTTPFVKGRAEANAHIKLYDNGLLIGEMETSGGGWWSYPFEIDTQLAAGSHSLTVTATDAAGNTSVQSDAFVFRVEPYAPPSAPSITSVVDDTSGAVQIPNEGVTKDSTPVLHGTAPAGVTVVKVYDGDMLLGQTQVNVQGNWVFTVPMQLSEGLHTLTATSIDVRGTPSGPSNSYQLTTDYTAPGQPVISQVLSDEGVIGSVAAGESTEDTTPRVTGTAEANARITLYDGNGSRLIGETTADASGNWAYQIPAGSALAVGGHSLTVTATDAAGNLSVPSNAFAFSVEAYVPPGAPSITSVVDDTSGAVQIPNGGVTKDSTPVLHGTAPAGATTVKVYDGDTLLGQTQVNVQGNWVFTVPMQLSEGLHSLTAKSVDIRGTPSGPSNSYQLTTDYTAPDKPVINQVISDEGRIGPIMQWEATKDSTPRVTGTAEANARIKLYDDNGSRLIGETTADTHGSWSYQIPTDSALVVGRHNLTVTATDAAGNLSVPSNAFVFSVEAYPPPSAPNITSAIDDSSGVAWVIPNTGITKDSTPVLHGTAPAGLTVNVYDGSTLLGQTQADVQGNWIFTLGVLSEGVHTLTATSVDVRGIVSVPSSVYQFRTDYTAPDKPVISQVISDEGMIGPITAGGSTQDSTPRVTGTAEANSRIKLYDGNGGRLIGETRADYNGNWTYQIPAGSALAVGSHNLMVTATDTVGNTSVQSNAFVLTVVTMMGTLTIDGMSKDSGVNDHDFVTADGTAGRGIYGHLSSEIRSGQKVQVSLDGGATWHDAVANGTSWAYTDTTAHSANWAIRARIIDNFGSTNYVQKDVTLLMNVGTPSITNIPDAVGGYTEQKALDGSQVNVSLVSSGAKAGDTLHIVWGHTTYDHVLTQANITAGSLVVNIPAQQTQAQGGINDFTVTAQIITQNGAIGRVSSGFDVVGSGAETNQAQAFNTSEFSDDSNLDGYVSVNGGFMIAGSDVQKRSSKNNYWPLSEMGSMYVGYGSTGMVIFNDGRGSVTLTYTGVESRYNRAIIKVYDIHGVLVKTEDITNPHGIQTAQVFNYTATGELIGRVDIIGDIYGTHILKIETSKFAHGPDVVSTNLIEHNWETYYGTEGDDVVSISVDPLAYFAQQGAEIHGGNGVDTLKLTGAGQVLNLSGLTGFNDAGKISSIEKFDITGTGNNTLKICLNDVLNLGQTNLFLNDGNVQVMVNGNSGDRVVLSGLHDTGVAPGQWAAGNAVSIGGTQYQVYQNSAMHAELLVQNNVIIELM